MTAKGLIRRKFEGIYQAYFLSSRIPFYSEMLLLRIKLQWYRLVQINQVKWFLKSFRQSYGLYFLGFSYLAYFLHFRDKYMFV